MAEKMRKDFVLNSIHWCLKTFLISICFYFIVQTTKLDFPKNYKDKYLDFPPAFPQNKIDTKAKRKITERNKSPIPFNSHF
jgi:hypothetical protein